MSPTDTNNKEMENVQPFIRERFGTDQDFSEQDKISITNFNDKKVAVLEQREETIPAFTISRAKQLFLQESDKKLSRKMNEEDHPGILSPSESIFIKNKSKLSPQKASLPSIIPKWVQSTIYQIQRYEN